MKITINKDTITLAQAQEAREYAEANKDAIDKDTIKCAAQSLIEKHHGGPAYVEELIGTPSLEVTIDHYVQMSIWMQNTVVKYWHKDDGERTGTKFAVVSMNLTDWFGGEVHGCLETFACAFQGIV